MKISDDTIYLAMLTLLSFTIDIWAIGTYNFEKTFIWTLITTIGLGLTLAMLYIDLTKKHEQKK